MARPLTAREFDALRPAAVEGPLVKLRHGGRWRANSIWDPACRSRAINALLGRGYLELVEGNWPRARITPAGLAAFNEECVA